MNLKNWTLVKQAAAGKRYIDPNILREVQTLIKQIRSTQKTAQSLGKKLEKAWGDVEVTGKKDRAEFVKETGRHPDDWSYTPDGESWMNAFEVVGWFAQMLTKGSGEGPLSYIEDAGDKLQSALESLR